MKSRVSVLICVCMCHLTREPPPPMQKSRLCAQGVRLACHYTSKTLLGGPKKELALAKLMLSFPRKAAATTCESPSCKEGCPYADLLGLLLAGTVNLATLAGATNDVG